MFEFEDSYQAPWLTPTVLNDPVVLAIFSAITDHQHGVVVVVWIAGAACVNTRRIIGEAPLGSVNGHRHWSISSHGILQRLLVTIRYIGIASYLITFGILVWAVAFIAEVWCRAWRQQALRVGVVEAVWWPTALAAPVGISTRFQTVH